MIPRNCGDFGCVVGYPASERAERQCGPSPEVNPGNAGPPLEKAPGPRPACLRAGSPDRADRRPLGLAEEQTRQIAGILDFKADAEHFYYYVEPYEPPEDNGLQQTTNEAR